MIQLGMLNTFDTPLNKKKWQLFLEEVINSNKSHKLPEAGEPAY
jgi:hypothetical protein